MLTGTMQYTKSSYLRWDAWFSQEVLITLVFQGVEMASKYYKYYTDKKGMYFNYKHERIYLDNFN